MNSLPIRASIEQVPDQPDAQVAATIARMNEYVCFDCQSGPVIYDAKVAVADNPSDPLSCIHSFVHSRMRFKNDEEIAAPYNGLLPGCAGASSIGNNAPNRAGDITDAGTAGATGQGQQYDPSANYFIEVLKRPVDVSLEYANTGQPVMGDCDDYSMYCAALLKALGIDCSFATIGADPTNPSVYSHVYVVAYWRGKRIPMDCSHGPYAGWETENKYGKFSEWPIYERSSLGLVGLAFVTLGWLAWSHRQTIRGLFA